MKKPQEVRRMEIKERIRNRIKNEELRFGWSIPQARKKRSQDQSLTLSTTTNLAKDDQNQGSRHRAR